MGMADLRGASMKESSIDDLAKFESCRSKQVLQRHKGLHRECEKMIQQFLKEARFETSRLARIQTRYKEKIKVFEKAEALSPARSVSTLSCNSRNSTVRHRDSVMNQSTSTSQNGFQKQKDNLAGNLPAMLLPKNDASRHLQSMQRHNTSDLSKGSYKTGGSGADRQLFFGQGTLAPPRPAAGSPRSSRMSRQNSISQSLPGNIGGGSPSRPASLTTSGGQSGSYGMSAGYPRSSTRNSHRRNLPQKKHKRQLLFRIEKIDGKITYFKETKPPDPLEKTFQTN